ncbi:MAG TPA: hypothetical protein VI298_09330 [Geobacteraceae bacterium]
MQMATALDENAWIAENTSFCNRLSARITEDACQNNRQISVKGNGVSCCRGCNGIHNQPERRAIQLQLVTSHASSDDKAELDRFMLDEEDGAETEIEVSEGELDYSEAWIDEEDLDEKLFELFPDLREINQEREDSPVEARRPRPEKGGVRFAVYLGRCTKCGGYMVNTRERQDDEVYRCFNCGWRTSPEYEWNRENLMSSHFSMKSTNMQKVG